MSLEQERGGGQGYAGDLHPTSIIQGPKAAKYVRTSSVDVP